MRLQRLLERIGNEGEDPLRSGLDEKTILVKSIVSHLNRMLNSRQGSVQIDSDYGLPHYASMSSRFSTDMTGTLGEIETAVRQAIAKYEPRLSGVKVRMLDKSEFDITMTLDLDAMIETDAGKERVPLRVVISPSGRVHASG